MINTIFWDFDGVLMNSNDIRDIGFEKVFSEYPAEDVNKLMAFHRNNGGLSRYVKFNYFFEEVRKESVSDDKMLFLLDKFSSIMRELLTNPTLLIRESLEYVKNNHNRINMHIMSGSDQVELRYLCQELGIDKYFISILGSPTPKVELVKLTINKYNYNVNNILFIGDSINDYEAANINNVNFMGYNNPEIEKLSDLNLF